jgi:eukaryotic-like serine/threonine-protein kinase
MNQPLHPGDLRRLGEYELLGRLGEGGMGTVYLGRAPDGRLVAIKMVRRDLAADDEFRRRFRSEVNRAREVPPFATAEVVGADPDHEPPYLVVEYVDGPSLASVVREQGPLRGAALQSVAVGIATALTGIHGARVIHRDLKPQNVLMARGGVKVIDFGIARPLELTSAHTRTDQMVGTVAYMAPERFEPEHAAAVGFPADIFAWGAVVAYAATGRTPFAADSAPGTAMRILTRPPSLDGLDGPLRDIVERSLAKDPADRPTARDLLDMLLASQHLPGVAEPSPPAPVDYATTPAAYESGNVAPPARRGRHRPAILAGTAVLLVLGGLFGAHLANGGSTGTGTGTGPTGAPSSPAAVAPAPSPVAGGLPGILAGERRALLHLANIDRDLALPQNAPAKAGGGTTPESVFLLVPKGSSYQIRSEVTDLAGTPRCLAVKRDEGGPASLGPGPCTDAKTTLFRLTPNGKSDEKNRPTYGMSNEEYGVVQWSETRRAIYVEEAGDFPATIEFSFVDRGAV